jgi:hypothetical protein
MQNPILARSALLLALPFTLSPLAGCAIIPDTPRVGQEAASQGTPIALGESAWLGDAIVTPLAVVEDSRCPVDAQCVQAGKLTVSTRITSTHWQQTVPLTLGEPHQVMNRSFLLAAVSPVQSAGQETPPGAYRFTFTSGR